METLVKRVNGFDVAAMAGTVAAIQSNPSLGAFELRVENTWVKGGHNWSNIQGFYGAGREDDSRKEPFRLDNDEPPVLLGNNIGPNPAEALLHGMVGCMTTSIALLAAARGIEVSSITARVKANLDLNGFLGLDPAVAKGYQKISVAYEIGGVSAAERQELLELARQSPMYNTLINPVDLELTAH